MFEAFAEAFAGHLRAIEAHTAALAAIGREPPPAPRWNQDWFPRLDAAAAYAMVRRVRPRRIVEIGSGHSTRFMARAIADGGIGCVLTSIDPQPRATLEGLPIEILRLPVQQCGAETFAALAPGDILFIDSSHRQTPGGDVEFLLQRVLPALPAGVLLHFHDIFLPDGYPAHWAWRRYDEQDAVAALLASGSYAPLFASAWVVSWRPAWLAQGILAQLPLMPGALESSLWLRRIDSGSGLANPATLAGQIPSPDL